MQHTVTVTLEYKEKRYCFDDAWCEYEGWTDEDYDKSMVYWWSDGNGGCDCNRSSYIQLNCDPNFPEMECGDEIELIDIVVRHISDSRTETMN